MAPEGIDRSPPRRRRTARPGPVVQVRRLHRRDLNKVWEFLKRSFRDVNLETVEYQRPRSKKRFYETYEEEGVEQLLFVVEGEILAYVECTYEIIGSDTWINPRYFEKRDMRPLFVEELAVHPDWHGRGVGSFVLEQIQHLAKVRGLTHLVLEVAENNTHAMQWYRKRGFRKLDAAVFMAFAVDVAPELLPPRALEGKLEPGADDSAILAIPVTPDGGSAEDTPPRNGASADRKKSSGKNGATREAHAAPSPRGRKKASRSAKVARKGGAVKSRAVKSRAVKPELTLEPKKLEPAAKLEPAVKPELKLEPKKLEPVRKADPATSPADAAAEPSNGQRRTPRAETAPPVAGPSLPPGRRPP